MSEYTNINLIEYPKRSIMKTVENKYWSRYKQVYDNKFTSSINFLSTCDSSNLLMIAYSNNLEFFDINKNKILFRFDKYDKPISSGSFKQNGQLSAVGYSNGLIKIFNLNSKKTLKNYFSNEKQPISSISFSPQKPNLYYSTDNLNISLYDYSLDKSLLIADKAHNDLIKQLYIDDNYCYSGSYDCNINAYDLNSNALISQFKHNEPVETFLNNCNYIYSANGYYLSIWDNRNYLNPVKIINNNNKIITSLCLNDKKNRLFVGSYDCYVKVYNIYDEADNNNNNFETVLHQFKYKNGVSGVIFKNNKLCASTVDGSFNIKTSPKLDTEMPENKFVNKEEQELYEMLNEGVKTVKKDYKFYTRGVYSKPLDEEIIIKIPMEKRKRLTKWDKFIRKFRYVEALQSGLDIFNTQVILTIIDELKQRHVLEPVIKKLNDDYLTILFKFILKKIDSSNCQSIILHILDIILLNKTETVVKNNTIFEILAQINDKINIEKSNLELISDLKNNFCLLNPTN